MAPGHPVSRLPPFSWSTAIAVVSSLALLITFAHPKICDVAATTRTRAASYAIDSSPGLVPAAQQLAAESLGSLYLDVLKNALTGISLRTPSFPFEGEGGEQPYDEVKLTVEWDGLADVRSVNGWPLSVKQYSRVIGGRTGK